MFKFIRTAQRALELALQTDTPCWVMRDGKIVDIAAEAAARDKAASGQCGEKNGR